MDNFTTGLELDPCALRAFHIELLANTLSNAQLTPFYQKLWADFDLASVSLETLSQLPLAHKEAIRTAGKQAQNRQGLVCDEIFTGGTSGAPPLITVKGDREQRYIHAFYTEVFASAAKQQKTRALQINNPYHGHLVNIPVPMYSHKIGVYDNGSFNHGRWVLQNQHCDKGVHDSCTVLVGLERCLRAFTCDTRQHHPNGIPTNLNFLISYSQILTKRWRKLFEDTWQCQVIDRFGLSEVFGGATYDPALGWWKFDPVLIPEVIGVHSQQNIHEGMGLLVLTGLFPFQEAQPMVRYMTGDLVQVTTGKPEHGLLIKPLGRAKYGVPAPESDLWLLTPLEVLEAVENFNEIRSIPRFLDSGQVSDPYYIGHPMYCLEYRQDKDITKIMLQVALTPATKEKRKKQILSTITENLLANKNLALAIKNGTADLNVNSAEELNTDLISHSN